MLTKMAAKMPIKIPAKSLQKMPKNNPAKMLVSATVALCICLTFLGKVLV
jgi:hypothetical protein